MMEVSVVKKCFDLKKILWFRGMGGNRQPEILQGMLSRIGVSESAVCWVSAKQFVDMVDRGTVGLFANQFQVLAISHFEFLSEEMLARFFQSMLFYFTFKKCFSFRVVLLSSPFFEQRRKFEEALKPIVINLPSVGENPSDLNERVHAALEFASLLAGKRVTRISEELACWVEAQSWDGNDEEMIALFVHALKWMNHGSVLDIRHLHAVIDDFDKKEPKISKNVRAAERPKNVV